MNKRDKIFKDLLDHYNVDYSKINLFYFSFALRTIIKNAKVSDDDGQFYFNFSIKEDSILDKTKRINNKHRTYRSIIIEEFINCKLIKLHMSARYGVSKCGNRDNKHLAEVYRLNKSVLCTLEDMKNKKDVIGIDKSFNIIDESIINELYNKDMEKKTRLQMEAELCDTLKRTKIEIPKDLRDKFYNIIDAPKIAYYNYETPTTTVSTKTGRIFHPMANLQKLYRQYMTMQVNGRKFPLKCVDLKSSQPLLLTSVINDEKYADIVKNQDIYDWLVEMASKTTYTFKNGDKTIEECIEIEKAQHDKTLSGSYKSPLTRDGMKVQFMRFVGSNKKLMIIDQILEQHLPEFYTSVTELKKKLDSDNYIKDENGDYLKESRIITKKDGKTYTKKIKVYKQPHEKVYLTTILQQIESDIFIGVWEQFSDMSIPLHDCLYFPYDASGRKIKNIEPKILKALADKFEEYGIDGYDLVCEIEAGKYPPIDYRAIMADHDKDGW